MTQNSNQKHKNIGLYLSNSCDKNLIIEDIETNNYLQEDIGLNSLQGAFYTQKTIDNYIREELLHDRFEFKTKSNSGLATMSSGERRKELWKYIKSINPDYIILDDVHGTIDKEAQENMESDLAILAKTKIIIQLFTRKRDVLPFVDTILLIDENNTIITKKSLKEFQAISKASLEHVSLPKQLFHKEVETNLLVEFNSVSIQYGDREILKNVNWIIKNGEFWQIIGPNGSGKSSLISLITGDNPRGYGQDLILFGKRKGSGESIWDIKKNLGYFTPSMLQQFTRNDTVENMIISGFMDSIGLYKRPNKTQINSANSWMKILGITDRKVRFRSISRGLQRVVLVARAMVKHPLLLILDEPTIELDEENSALFVDLINTIQKEKNTAIIYVSHRDEQNLHPEKVFALVYNGNEFIGQVIP